MQNLQDKRMGVIRQKGATVRSPVDGKVGAAYVHCLDCKKNVGRAYFMLSYSWGYSIGDIIDALVDFCKSNKIKSKRAYVWICYLCVNQHRVAELAEQKRSGMLLVSALDFFGLYGERVAENGHVLAMMALRNNPDNLKQVWCIFELYTAHTKRCELTIVMPPAQKATLEEAMFGEESRNIDTLYGVLAED